MSFFNWFFALILQFSVWVTDLDLYIRKPAYGCIFLIENWQFCGCVFLCLIMSVSLMLKMLCKCTNTTHSIALLTMLKTKQKRAERQQMFDFIFLRWHRKSNYISNFKSFKISTETERKCLLKGSASQIIPLKEISRLLNNVTNVALNSF